MYTTLVRHLHTVSQGKIFLQKTNILNNIFVRNIYPGNLNTFTEKLNRQLIYIDSGFAGQN